MIPKKVPVPGSLEVDRDTSHSGPVHPEGCAGGLPPLSVEWSQLMESSVVRVDQGDGRVPLLVGVPPRVGTLDRVGPMGPGGYKIGSAIPVEGGTTLLTGLGVPGDEGN